MRESSIHLAIQTCFDTWGLNAEEITVLNNQTNTKEVTVKFTGDLIFSEFFDEHGPLMYNKNLEITLKGVTDGCLLLTVNKKSN